MPQQSLQTTSRRIILVQSGLGGITSLAVYVITLSWLAMISALFGALIAVTASFVSASRMQRASKLAYQQPRAGVAVLYAGATLRFLIVIFAFALGIGLLKLPALYMIMAFAIAQLGYLSPLFEKV